MATDFELLDAWAEGDKKAARELVQRHFKPLFRFFSSKVAEGVEDLVQECMLACVQSRERFRRESTFRTYLFHTARHVLLGHFRKQRRSPIDFETVSAVALSPSPSAIVVRKAEHRLLLTAIRHIPLEHQIVLELYYWEELTGPQLAEVLEITEPALRSRLHRAKQELRRQMEAVAASPEVLESTWTGLDGWARSLREQLDRDPR